MEPFGARHVEGQAKSRNCGKKRRRPIVGSVLGMGK
jgi:hypothetical protein